MNYPSRAGRLVEMRALTIVALLLVPSAHGCQQAQCPEGTAPEADSCVVVQDECGCAPREQCIQTGAGVDCVCIPGYAGDPCVWGGAPRDPGFETDDTWSSLNGASVQPGGSGRAGNLGLALFDPTSTCGGARVTQVFEMPDVEAAESLVAEVIYRSPTTIDLGFGRAYHQLPGSTPPTPADENGWASGRFCLGEAAYGGDVEFQVSSSERVSACFDQPTDQVEIDVFRIDTPEPDEECPPPGTVSNGSGERDGGGWIFDVGTAAAQGLAEGAIVDGVGRDGTSAARIFKETNIGNEATMRTLASVPELAPDMRPALTFWWKATPGSVFFAELRRPPLDRFLDTLLGDGLWQEHTYCLPAWTYGVVIDLFFSLLKSDVDAELIVDDVRLRSVEACGESPDILDPSFESAPNRWPGVRVSGGGDSIRVVEDADEARTGTGVLEMAYTANTQRLVFQHWFFVPQSDSTGGPELVFHSKVPPDAGLPVRWFLEFAQETKGDLVPDPGGGWATTDVCLPPDWSGRWMRVTVRAGPKLGEDPVVTFDPPARILLDDFTLRTSPNCPATP